MKVVNGVVVELTIKELDALHDDCQEIIHNPNGTVTYVFDEPGINAGTSGVTVSKEAEEKAAIEYEKNRPKEPTGLAKILPFIMPKF